MSKQQYLYIFEDGQIKSARWISDESLASCNYGILDVIDISGDVPKQFFEGEWHDIESVD